MAGSATPSNAGYKARYVSAMACLVGSATLPQGSLYAAAAQGFALIEACYYRQGGSLALQCNLYRLTTTGTPGAAGVAAKFDDDAPAALCLPKNTHSVAPALGDKLHPIRLTTQASIGAWFGFHDVPIEVGSGTANGVGWLMVGAATSDADVTFVWEE